MKKAIWSLLVTAAATAIYIIKKENQLHKYEQLDHGDNIND
jgi:hypothetical protein